MHHSDKPIPGTYSAAMLLAIDATLTAALAIGALVWIARVASWAWRLF